MDDTTPAMETTSEVAQKTAVEAPETSVEPETLPEVEATPEIASEAGSEAPVETEDLKSDETTEEVPADELEANESVEEISPEAKAFLDKLADKFDELKADHESALSQVHELEQQNADLRDRLLDLTIAQALKAENKRLKDSALALIDRSRLLGEDGLPDESAVSQMVKAFGHDPYPDASKLGIGPQGGGYRPAKGYGYGPDGSYWGNSNKLDARNR
jgi:hypothetical protein